MLIDDATFEKASKRAKVDIFADEDEPEEVEMDDFEVEEEQPPQIGFFTALALGLGLASKSKPHKHNGKCNGDCANCPAHYGYRYGRWYYVITIPTVASLAETEVADVWKKERTGTATD